MRVRLWTRSKGEERGINTAIRATWEIWLLVSDIKDDTLDCYVAWEALRACINVSFIAISWPNRGQ